MQPSDEGNPENENNAPSLDDAVEAAEGSAPPIVDHLQEAADEQESEERALHQRIAELEDELAVTNDRMLRALAETENTRRRSAKDREESNLYGGFRLARDLLPVHDNFKRAMQSIDDSLRASAGDFIEGVELTQKELTNALAKHKITPIHPEIGEKFDADKHQAMFEAPVPGAENGTIIEVMQDGFMCADRLLRAAMVGVARGTADKPNEET